MLRSKLLAALAAVAASASPGFVTYDDVRGTPYTVTYDNRSFIVNGQRTLFISSGVHYPRATPLMWKDIFAKVKADGATMIQTYVFWNAHEHKKGALDFGGSVNGGIAGSYNLTAFLIEAQNAGLFVNLRIGPYVCAEWNFGGFPLWLTREPDVRARSSARGWELAMGKFFNETVTYFRSLGLFADAGGPIALAQVENELNTGDTAYVEWCGTLAAEQNLPIPWLMCNGKSAHNTVNSCNGGDCQGFIESAGQNGRVLIDQPAAWTEAWSPWYQQWGDGGDSLPAYNGATSAGAARDETFKAAKWFARGGSHINWYMAFGGNNYRRMQGASTRPEYYTGAQLQPDAVGNEPFRSHSAAFYAALRAIAPAILSYPAQVHKEVNLQFVAEGSTGPWVTTGKQYAFIYGSPGASGSAAFLENIGDSGTVLFGGRNFSSRGGGSIIVVDSSLSVLFDTSAVSPAHQSRSWKPVDPDEPYTWRAYSEVPPLPDSPSRPPAAPGSTVGSLVSSTSAAEQLALTEDDTEWAVYSAFVTAAVARRALAHAETLGSPDSVQLEVTTGRATALTAFFGAGVAPDASSGYETSEGSGSCTITLAVPSAGLRAALAANPEATTALVIVSESLGIDKFSSIDNTNTTFSTSAIKGITGKVTLGGVDITNAGWASQSGLFGEANPAIWTTAGRSRVTWTPVSQGISSGTALTWFRTTFIAPDLALLVREDGGGDVNASLHLDSTGLSRAHFYVNDWEISRAWGNRNCGSAQCQRYYHIPPDILLPPPAQNILTVFDAEGAPNLTSVRVVLSQVAPPPPCGLPAAGMYVTTGMCRPAPSSAQQFKFTPTAATTVYSARAGAVTGSIGVVNSNLCWAVGGANPVTGTPGVILADCDSSSPAQKWSLTASPGTASTGLIQSVQNSTCVDIPNMVDNGGPVDLWACNNGSNQLWTFGTDGFLTSALSGNCAGVC